MRVCLSCGAKLIGRSDKKFCNDGCRGFYNNSKNRSIKKSSTEFKYLSKTKEITEFLMLKKRIFALKIIYFVAKLCKIISNFEV